MKLSKIIIVLIVLLLFTGCDKEKENKKIVTTPSESPISNEAVHEHCTRVGTIQEGSVNLSYELYYKGDILNLLESTEQVISDSSSVLDLYENAYKSIHSHYNDLEYYDTSVLRDDGQVTSKITINYEKIDIDKLIDIEGEEDNIFEDKVPKVSKWKEMAKKVGTKCSVVVAE